MCKKLILLAEDDPSHQELFRRAVQKSGMDCDLRIVFDGVEAVDYLFSVGSYSQRDPDEVLDLIVLDLRMPRMDGFQVLQVLHRVRNNDHARFPPVIVLTSSENEQDIAEAYRWGAQSYIRKPLDFGEFAVAVRETLAYWLHRNVAPPVYKPGAQFARESVCSPELKT